LSTLKIPTAKVFEPLLQPARYKGAHGGRGSGKLLVWDKVLGLGTTDPLAGVRINHVESRRFVLFCQARFRKRCTDYQAMTGLQAAEVRAIVVETLAEQQRLRHDDIDAVVLKAVASTLTSFGFEEEDRRELRADLQHLRRWRKSVEQAQSYAFKAVITVIVTGFVGAVWLGVKATLGK
jgi:hypothetical protein